MLGSEKMWEQAVLIEVVPVFARRDWGKSRRISWEEAVLIEVVPVVA
jgi:hypothetical protein